MQLFHSLNSISKHGLKQLFIIIIDYYTFVGYVLCTYTVNNYLCGIKRIPPGITNIIILFTVLVLRCKKCDILIPE
jgi:hypothetical protein